MEVNGIRREGNEKLLRNGRNQIWFCDGCGKPFIWDRDSHIFSSLKDEENMDLHRMWIACSDACKSLKPSGFPKGVKRPKGSLVVSHRVVRSISPRHNLTNV